MTHRFPLIELEAFAKKKIAAEKYPNDYHCFKLFKCDQCGLVPFQLTIEHHTGTKRGNFKGRIFGVCHKCGQKKRLFSFTNDQRKTLSVEHPVCPCGCQFYLTGECERFEDDDGRMGFFDEGVMVGSCFQCNEIRVLVETD